MAFTSIPNSDTDANSPITTALMTALRDNHDWNVAKVQTVTAAGTLDGDDNNMLSLLDGTTSAFTYNLPASPATGMVALFLMTVATNDVTLSGNGKNINGASSITFAAVRQYLRIRFDGTEWKSMANPSLVNVQVFTGNGTYTPTPGATKALMRVIGPGGGGGGVTSSSSSAAGGGAAGGYGIELVDLSGITSETVTVPGGGSGGNGTSNGSGGGTASVGSIVSATGGGGGQSVTNGSDPGAGGSGSGGDINGGGSDGGANGHGGASLMGGATRTNAAGFGNGVTGKNYGGGGSGATGDSSGTYTGGSGAPGLVVIEEYA